MIGMAFGIQHLFEHDLRDAVRLVLDALPALVLHDVALRVDGHRRHRVEQVTHPIGLEEEGELERVRRHVDVVVRPIVRRGTIVLAADALEPRVELARLDVPGAHEHQVLEQMREARASRALVRGSHVIPDVHADERHAVILVEDHVQTVAKRE